MIFVVCITMSVVVNHTICRFLVSTCVEITVYQCGKCFIFLKYCTHNIFSQFFTD